MLTPALRLDMALYSTSMAYDLALPIVALPIVTHLTLRTSSPIFLPPKHRGIWRKTSGPAEAGFEGQEVGDHTRDCVRLLSELECGCKGSPFFSIREVGHDVEFHPTVFNRNVTY